MENKQKEKLRKLGLTDEQVEGVVRLIENQEHFKMNEVDDDGDPYDLSVHSPGSGYYEPDVPAPKKFTGIDMNYVQEVYEEISLMVRYDLIDKNTRDKIKGLMEKKLPYYRIKCDEENNSIDVTASGHIRARVTDPATQNYIDLKY